MKEFLEEVSRKACPSTVLSYRRDLNELFEFLGQETLVTEDALREYFSRLATRLSSTGFARAVSVARQYFAFCKLKGYMAENPMENLRASQFSQRDEFFLDTEDIRRLLDSGFYGLRGRRDLAMLTLICQTGIKVSELVALSQSDFSPSEGTLLCGSGSRRRKICLESGTVKLLSEISLLSGLQSGGDSPLFLGSTGKRMTRQGFWKNLKDRAVLSGIENCTPEILRRSLARHLLQEGASRERVRSLLGNSGEGKLRDYEKKDKGL